MTKTATDPEIKKDYSYHRAFEILFLILIIVIFVAYKYDHMQLPYFWDEAWSYIPAIMAMQESGPSLLPTTIDPELYKGHPLFFYFTSSLWLSLFGDSIFVSRMFPMAISLCTIVSIYRLAKEFFGLGVAIASTLLFSIQSVFVVQSSFLLPEILLSLLGVLTFHAFLSKNQTGICIWLSLAMLTKESAAVLWITLFLVTFINYFKENLRISFLREFWFLVIPAVLFVLFLVLQKIRTGWFFYPEHMDYLSFRAFGKTLRDSSEYLFWDMGRSLLTTGGFLSAMYLVFIKKIKWNTRTSHILLFAAFIVFFLIFSSINFYTPRYLLPIFPFAIMIFVFFIETALKRKPRVLVSLFLVIFCFNLYFTFTKKGGNDHSLGFKDAVQCHLECIRYCEQKNYHDRYIVTHFLMRQNLKNKHLGYLEKFPFSRVSAYGYDSMEIAIISSIEYNKNFEEEIKKRNGRLVKRFDCGIEWSEIYEID